jgi:hypothetical protein
VDETTAQLRISKLCQDHAHCCSLSWSWSLDCCKW